MTGAHVFTVRSAAGQFPYPPMSHCVEEAGRPSAPGPPPRFLSLLRVKPKAHCGLSGRDEAGVCLALCRSGRTSRRYSFSAACRFPHSTGKPRWPRFRPTPLAYQHITGMLTTSLELAENQGEGDIGQGGILPSKAVADWLRRACSATRLRTAAVSSSRPEPWTILPGPLPSPPCLPPSLPR